MVTEDWLAAPHLGGVLFDGGGEALIALNKQVADRPGPILMVQTKPYGREWLLEETSVSTNTAAAGGNATLMAIS